MDKETKSRLFGFFIGIIVSFIILSIIVWPNVRSNIAYKPIIYLYPTEETNVTVKLGYPETLIIDYPKYNDGWNVLAKPNGDLIDLNTNNKLYSLYYENKIVVKNDMKEGFVVKGEDTIPFLEEKLTTLGLNYKEKQEFIIYWAIELQKNKYNYIYFATNEEVEKYMPLDINPTPDSLIRILMEYKPLNKYIEVEEQQLTTPERKGFVVVEWGGTRIR